jgi:signal transduction histidine kinase
MATVPVSVQSREGYSGRDSAQLALLVETAHDLLTHTEPQEFLQLLFKRLATYCGLEVCFSYWVTGDRLKLAFATGVSEEVQRQIEWLDYGQAVCGTVALKGTCMTAEEIQNNPQQITTWVRSMGVQAYCCHPLMAHGKLLGTLSFGTRTRSRFTEAEVSLMKAVSDQASAALERFLMLRELKDKNEQLQRANEDLRQFSYAISHDLQEPVRTIAVYSQWLQRDISDKLTAEERQRLEFATSASRHLAELLDGLQTYTHASNGAPPPKVIDLRQALQTALASCSALLEENKAEVVADMPAIDVSANLLQMSQVFQNLISNAVKYRREGERPRIEISTVSGNSELIVAVRDNGQGIPPQFREQVFELFKRLHGKNVSGAGIGLATTKRIIERHGGRIWVENSDGCGTTMCFSLPAHRDGASDSAL